MITSLRIKNFKSLRDVDLRLGKLNFFIGSNASGKSNVFDALRVLQGIGNGFTLSEILDGKPRSATSEIWEAVRGGSANAAFAAKPDSPIEFQVTTSKAEYGISFMPQSGRLTEEWLADVYDSRRETQKLANDPSFEVKYYQGKRGRQPYLKFGITRPVLTQFPKAAHGDKLLPADVERCVELAIQLANMQRLDPSPALLRTYSQAQQIRRMGERGENFAALIRTICADDKLKDAYLSWLRHLRPDEVEDVGTLSGAIGDTIFMLKEGGRNFPAPVLSDGTLRFAAITAAFFQPDMPALLTLEEIENGIHATRLRLLVELLRNRTEESSSQVIVTTHSPLILAWLQEREYAHTFFCKRDPATGESRICPVTEIPHFMDVIKRQPIGDLFAEGWMEASI